MPLLECLISTHNNEQYLDQCLESLEKQTFQDFKILIYDNHSTDNTCKIIQKWQKKINKIEIFSGKNHSSAAYGLNQLIKKVKSKYFAFQFPNDFSHPSRFEKQIDRLKNSSLVALGTSITWDGSSMEQSPQEVIASENPKETLFQQIGSKNHRGMFVESMMYKTKEVKKSTLFNPSLPIHYDVEFHAHLQSLYPLRLANLKEPLYSIRVFKGSVHDLEFHGQIKVDNEQIERRIYPILFFAKYLYWDNMIISNGFLPY